MASTYLTPTAVTRAVASVLHQKGKLLNRVNRQYDAQSPDGRKAGGSLTIRMPNEYTVRRTSVMASQDTAEASEALVIAQPFGVDMNFTDSELALKIEDFTKRIITPAVNVLVSNIESYFIDDFSKSVANVVDNDGSAISFLNIMQARQKLIENLAPEDEEELSLFLSPTHNTKYVDATKGLFTPAGTIGAQYKNGMVGPVANVGWVGSSTHLTDLATGTAAKVTGYLTDIAGVEDKGDAGSIHVDTGVTTFKVGDVFTIESVNAVHPETKADLGYLKPLVVTTDFAGGEGDLKFSVGIGGAKGLVASGARQNCTAMPVDGKAIVKMCAGASEKQNRSLYFHRDAYAVAFADLENPGRYGAWADVQQIDGISVRVWRAGDIVNGKFPCRLDVLAGGKCIRPQLAARIHADG